MKWMYTRIVVVFLPILTAFALATTACGPDMTCEKDSDCSKAGANYVCNQTTKKCEPGKDGGDKEPGKEKQKEVSPGEESTQPEKKDEEPSSPPDGGEMPEKSESTGEKEPTEKKPDDGICPPGCADCGGKPAKKERGAFCDMPKQGEENPCKAGLTCFDNGIGDRAYCYKTCQTEKDCDTGTKCIEIQNAKQAKLKVCAVQNAEKETCNYSQQAFCQAGLTCLVSDEEHTAGTCYKRCQQDAECTPGDVCRPFNASQPDSKLCMAPILPGPHCVGERCSSNSTATNCMKGLTCKDGFCFKECKSATEDKDCDTKGGEVCNHPFTQPKGTCVPPASVTKAGEECTGLKRCDEKKGLKCIGITAEKSMCMKMCDESKGKENNPDCPDATYLCEKRSGLSFALCFKSAKMGENCAGGASCSNKMSLCINLGGDEAYCLRLCEVKKNKSKDDKTNPDCDGGKGDCIQLSGGKEIDGVFYDGACLPYRVKKLDVGENCGTDGDLRKPTCKEGTRCVGLRGLPHPVCFVDCDPCKADKKGGKWVHSACGGEACTPLVYSDGRSAGGICQIKGKPVLDEYEYCGVDINKGCKEHLLCVGFSNAEDAKSLCVKKCDLSKGDTKNPDCNDDRCAALTSGDGACYPRPQRRQKIGEECLGDAGVDGFHDCLEKQDGKKLICARSAFPGLPRTCQVKCDPINGIQENTDCKAAGLNNHLCLPADSRNPRNGACLEKCQMIDPLRCKTSKCQVGRCNETTLGKEGDCKDSTKEAECKKNGGACRNKTCYVSVCN